MFILKEGPLTSTVFMDSLLCCRVNCIKTDFSHLHISSQIQCNKPSSLNYAQLSPTNDKNEIKSCDALCKICEGDMRDYTVMHLTSKVSEGKCLLCGFLGFKGYV